MLKITYLFTFHTIIIITFFFCINLYSLCFRKDYTFVMDVLFVLSIGKAQTDPLLLAARAWTQTEPPKVTGQGNLHSQTVSDSNA